MTNIEIIMSEIKIHELKLDENYMEKFGSLPYKTYQEWKKYGYQVKKGEKAIIKTKLWKKTSKKIVVENKEETENKFVLVNASLFSLAQVEKF